MEYFPRWAGGDAVRLHCNAEGAAAFPVLLPYFPPALKGDVVGLALVVHTGFPA